MDDQTTQDQQGQDHPGDDAQVSQETPQTDSNLTTPQADQPVPNESERDGQGQETQSEQPPADAAVQQDESAGEPPRETDRPAARDQVAEEAQRESERQEQRQEHNERTGGGEVTTTERVEQREVHNERTEGTFPDPGEASDGAE